jgi:glycosyltransferase involved in cell wall biosynthesis
LSILVSIVIPTYNRGNLIDDVLGSVQNLNYSNWECIVVDDFSTDNTLQKVSKWSERDSRFKYVLNARKKGAQGARNTGVLASKGSWICFLDSDDLLTKNSVNDRIACLDALDDNMIGIIYGDNNLKYKRIEGNAKNWMIKNMALCPFSVIMANKNLVFNDYLLDERFPSWQDDDFVFYVSQKFSVYHCGTQVAYYNPVGNEFSITRSIDSQRRGLALMIKKRKKNIISSIGVRYLGYWYLRLLVKNIDFYEKKLHVTEFKIYRIAKKFLISSIDRILIGKFDLLHEE